MKDTSPILILLVLFIILGFAYGPLKATQNSSGTKGSYSSTISGKVASNSTNKNVASGIKDVEKNLEKISRELTEKAEEAKRSPYYGKISMSSIAGLYKNDPSKQYTTLSTHLNNSETVNITGWYIKSAATNNTIPIGQASLLPFPFSKTYSDIVLQKGDKVTITKGFSPIGISFRTNECTGFFEENRTFYPALPTNCPRIKKEELPTFSSDYDRNKECIDIIESIPSCQTVDNEFIRDLPDTVTRSCKNYLTTQINYNSCVAKHFDDTSFPGNQYRVYLNILGPLWRTENEKVYLLDKNGLIVDSISY